MRIKYPFRWLHAVVVVIGIAVCGVLLSAQSGHPPGIMFLPLAVAAWITIHVFIALMQAIATRGARRAQKQGMETEGWPIALILIVLVFGVLFLYQFAGMVEWWMSNEAWGKRLTIIPVFALFAFACSCGILLRRNWGRYLTASASFLIAIYFAYRAMPQIFSEKGVSFGLQLYALGIITAFSLLGVYLLRSPRIRSFFS